MTTPHDVIQLRSHANATDAATANKSDIKNHTESRGAAMTKSIFGHGIFANQISKKMSTCDINGSRIVR